MAIASLVLGILSLIIMWIPFISFVAIILSVIGIILGAIGKKQLATAGQPTGMATAGIVLSIISLALSTIFVIACGACAAAVSSLASL